MYRYLLVDAMNMFFRARHIAHKGSDISERVGMSQHLVLMSIQKAWKLHNADHVVVCLDGRSWRKDFYPPYKRNREVAKQALTDTERDENEAYFLAFADLIDFLEEKTNVTVVSSDIGEADDLIARWIAKHQFDQHTIVSSDTDMVQLLASNVDQYNGITQELITLKGITDDKGKPVIDKKTKQPKIVDDPAWTLFLKCIRGDPTDNVFSAYPRAPVKATKNKVGLDEAFADRAKKGYAWNNVMLQRWTDHNKVEHLVKDDFERNVTLIDLTAQPDNIKAVIDAAINEASKPKKKAMVGAQFLKFCGKHDLVKLSESATIFGTILNASYPE